MAIGKTNALYALDIVEDTEDRAISAQISGASIGAKYGNYILNNNSGSGAHYGTANTLSGAGVGTHYGSFQNLSTGGGGPKYGVYSRITGAGNAARYGTYNWITSATSGDNTGTYNILDGTGSGPRYGTQNIVNSNSTGRIYGTYNTVLGNGTERKFGSYNFVNQASGGMHFAVYAEARKIGSFAGLFNGRVAIGESSFISGTPDWYILPATRGTNGQVMQTDASGNVSWVDLPIASNDWSLLGNSGTDPTINFLGTSDNQDLVFKTDDTEAYRIDTNGSLRSPNGNIKWGQLTGEDLTSGFANSLLGNNAGQDITTGAQNILIGSSAGRSVTTGNSVIAIGLNALGQYRGTFTSLAIGAYALASNTTGFGSIALGSSSLRFNVTGSNNVAIGNDALENGTASSANVAIGNLALENATGFNNIAIGLGTLRGLTSGSSNTAVGKEAGLRNVGSGNTILGYFASIFTTTGNDNTVIGREAGRNGNMGNDNVLLGANTGRQLTGASNIFIGHDSGSTLTSVSNRLVINNSNTLTPLVYGEFDTNIFRINGTIQSGNPATSGYAFPSLDGTANQILQTDGNGAANWVSLPTESNDWTTLGNSGTNPATNFIGTTNNVDFTFRTNNIQQWRMSTKGQWESLQNRGAIYIGENAGDNDVSASALFDVNARIFIGKNAGRNNTTGNSNLAIGPSALRLNTDGAENIAIGTRALELTTGDNNTAVGTFSLDASTGSDNTAVGSLSLSNTTSGESNTALGTTAGMGNTTGQRNVFIGTGTARFNGGGSNNVTIGYVSSFNNNGNSNTVLGANSGTGRENSNSNVLIGSQALSSNAISSGSQNTVLGTEAGFNASSVNGNVLIGYQAGFGITQSNSLYIENSNSSTPLIYGEFDNDVVQTNGELRINDPATANNSALLKNDNRYNHSTDNNLNFGNGSDYFLLSSEEGSGETGGIRGDGNNLAVWSPADGTRLIRFLDEDFWGDNNGNPYDNGAERAYIDPNGNYFQVSDRNKKNNIKAINKISALSKVSKLNGYTYTFKQSVEDRRKGNPIITSAGLLAQELLTEIPESVSKNEGDDYLVNYQAIIPYLVEAVKELKGQLLLQKREIELLKNKLIEKVP